jgi:hypothetical protein
MKQCEHVGNAWAPGVKSLQLKQLKQLVKIRVKDLEVQGRSTTFRNSRAWEAGS